MGKEYFSHDYGTRNKLKMAALIENTGSRGYGLFWIIVEMMYEANGNWLDLQEYTYLAIKKESKDEVDYIRQFVRDCIDIYKVFVEKDGKISTDRVHRNIEKRNEISEKNSKNGKKSAEKRRLQSISSEQTLTTVEQPLSENERNPTNKRKVNKRKLQNTDISSPADEPQGASNKKDPEPFWNKIVDAWFLFNEQKFGERPSFKTSDPRDLKKIIGQLKKRAIAKSVEWTEDEATTRFNAYLEKSFEDPWLKTHFLLKNLESQFDKIVLNHGSHQQTSAGSSGKSQSGKSSGASQLAGMLKTELTTKVNT